MNSRKYTNAVYIGRFQPFHKGHLDGIRVALEKADIVTIVVGSCDRPRSPRNPFTFEERESMIWDALRDEIPGDTLAQRIKIHPIRDRYNYNLWTQDVQNCVAADLAQDPRVCLVGHKKSDTEYLDAFPQWSYLEVPMVTEIDATTLRNIYYTDVSKLYELTCIPQGVFKFLWGWSLAHAEDYKYLRREFEYYQEDKKSWSNTPYPVIFNTVDSIVIRSGHVLMVRRKFHPGKGLLALPGGFLNPREFSLDGAIREQQKEEAKMNLAPLGIKRPSDLKRFVVGRDFYEHPDRSERGRVITFAYMFDLGDGVLPDLKAGDDAGEALWVPLADISKLHTKIFDDHATIIEDMANRFGKKF